MYEQEIIDIQNGAMKSAEEIMRIRKRQFELAKFKYGCICVVLSVALICACVLGCFAIVTQQRTILEQQYALNMQYASLTDLLSGAEITTTTNEADSGDGGTAIAGNDNTYVGGDLNGES